MTSVPTLTPRQHRMLDLAYGVALIATPFLLMSRRNRYSVAGLLPVVLGVGSLIQRNRTRYERNNNDPANTKMGLRSHLVSDSLSGLALAASPFLLGFARRSFLPHVLLGLGEVGVALYTRYGRQGRPFGQALADEANLGSNGSGRQPGNGSRQDQSGTDRGQSGHGQTYQNQMQGAGQDHGFATTPPDNNRMETWASDISGNVGSQAQVITDDMGLHGTGGGTQNEGIAQSSQSDAAWNAAPMANVIVPPGQDDDLNAGQGLGQDRAAQNRELTAEFEGRETLDEAGEDDDRLQEQSVAGDLGSGERDVDTDPSSVDSPAFGAGETPGRRSRSRKGAGAIARGPAEGQARENASDDSVRPAHDSDEEVPGTL